MSGYLSNLASRAVEQPPSIRPRLASLFEPTSGPRIRVAEPLAPKRSMRPPSVPRRHEDHTTATRLAEADVELSAIHRSAERESEPAESSHPGRDHRPKVKHESDSLTERSTQASAPHATVVRNTKSKVERGPATESIEKNIGHQRVPPASDEQAYRAELEAAPPGPEAALLERTVIVETPVSAPVEQTLVEAVTTRVQRETHPRPVVIVRPDVTASYESPAPSIETPAITHETPPAIRITIGRVDVRAIMPQAQPAAPARETERVASLSLDEYLKKRNGAKP